MNLIDEIDALKKTVELLTPLEQEARVRVLNYAYQAFGTPTGNRPKTQGADTLAKAPAPAMPALSGSSEKPVSPQEFLRTYAYKIMTKRIAVIGVFLERARAKKRFSLRDITEAFRDAKEPKMPAHSQFARAQAMGFLAKEGEQFYATSKAEALVDSYGSDDTKSDEASASE